MPHKVSNAFLKNPEFVQSGALAILAILFAWFIFTHAWVTDDAYFTFRTVENWVNGYGLTWNIAERVQVFTHPLWMFLLSAFYFVTREVYLTSIVLSLIVSVVAILLLVLRVSPSRIAAILGIVLLSASTAYVDYSTSGLENSLSHLLIVVFCLVVALGERVKHRFFWIGFVACLAALNRLDTVLLFLPVLAIELAFAKNRKTAALELFLGFVPLIVWEIFSLIYYGFPFPNTYYAKTYNFLPLYQKVWSGLNYLWFTLLYDPVTILVIFMGSILLFTRRHRIATGFALGALAYVFYVVMVGGDFMGGRLLTPAYLLIVVGLVLFWFPKITVRHSVILMAVIFVASLFAASPAYTLYARNFQVSRWNLVVDQRMRFIRAGLFQMDDFRAFNTDPQHNWINNGAFFARSILRGTAFRTEPEDDWVKLGKSLRNHADETGPFVETHISGIVAYYAGPEVHVVNNAAITDPLLAHIPPIYSSNWRPGHFFRVIPAGYVQVLQGDADALQDETIASYYERIRSVTRGSLFATARLAAIWQLNTVKFSDFAPEKVDALRFPNMQYVEYSEVLAAEQTNTPLAFTFSEDGSGVEVVLAEPSSASQLLIELGANDHYEIQYLDQAESVIATNRVFGELNVSEGATMSYELAIPAKASRLGFFGIRIVGLRVPNYTPDEQQIVGLIRLQ
jgi:arabinofuranosyltransferase